MAFGKTVIKAFFRRLDVDFAIWLYIAASQISSYFSLINASRRAGKTLLPCNGEM